jgi:hypothetical protein
VRAGCYEREPAMDPKPKPLDINTDTPSDPDAYWLYWIGSTRLPYECLVHRFRDANRIVAMREDLVFCHDA